MSVLECPRLRYVRASVSTLYPPSQDYQDHIQGYDKHHSSSLRVLGLRAWELCKLGLRCHIVHLQSRALEVIVTFRWRHRGLPGSDPPVSMCHICLQRDEETPSGLEKIYSVHGIKVTQKAKWQWWDFLTHGTSLWLVEALCGKSNTMTERKDFVIGSVLW
jgi:hypothetical protein